MLFSSISGKDLTIIEVSETGYFAKWPNFNFIQLASQSKIAYRAGIEPSPPRLVGEWLIHCATSQDQYVPTPGIEPGPSG